VRVRDLSRLLRDDGWRLACWRGNHRQYQHPVKRGTVTVSGTTHAALPHGALASVLERAGIEKDHER